MSAPIQFGIRVTADSSQATGELQKLERSVEGARNQLDATAGAAGRSANQVNHAGRAAAFAASRFNTAGLSVGQISNAMRTLPAQFTDIAVSLQAGQAPLTVLLQQGGQLSDVFGGIGPAARAMGGYIAGLISPLTLASGAAIALATAWAQGDAESASYRRSLALTGNAAGVTASQLAMMARQASAEGGTQGGASRILNQLVETGRVASDVMGEVSRSIAAMSAAGGEDVASLVARFKAIGEDPVKGILKLNEAYNFLTPKVYEQIRALQAQGRDEDAVRLAQLEAAKAVETRAADVDRSAGTMERAWRAVAGAAASAWDSMLGISREEPLQQQIENQRRIIDRLQGSASPQRSMISGGSVGFDTSPALVAARSRLTILEEQLKKENETAAAGAKTAEAMRAYKAANDAVIAAQGKGLAQQKTLNEALAEYRANLALLRRETPDSPALQSGNIAAGEAAIRKQYQQRIPSARDLNLGADSEAAQAYSRTLESLISIERAAGAEGQKLSRSQLALRELMLSPEWARMPEPWRQLIQAQSESSAAAEATGVFQSMLVQIDAGLLDVTKSTMGLDAAQSALFDLMVSPAWLQMTEVERQAAAARAETASATLKELELERALLAARSQTASAAGARRQTQIDYINQQYQAGRFGELGSDEAEKARKEIVDVISSRGVTDSLSGSIARAVVSGFSSGADAIQTLGDTLQRVLMQRSAEGLEKGISKALDVASSWIADLFKSAASGGSSGGGWISSIVSWFASAKGNAFAGNGAVQAFAAGGAFGAGEVLTRPTYFRFADGGAWRNGVAGEAGPEAALPLKRMSNGKLGVYADFAGATAAGSTSGVYVAITVNADGSARTESSASEGANASTSNYAEFGRRLETVVRGVIATELRPGGLLAGA